MPTCIVDGKSVEFTPGENLVEVAKRAGITIPVFCYHPGLSVVAQCRMCAVSVEKMPKLQTACSTAATEGMVVNTQSDAAKKNRESVMEFLLVNHPLDCPICDKSGECDLQDHSFDYGSAYLRSSEERRTFIDLDMGPVIQKSMNRCIHCTRCIRFGAEVAGAREMVALQRGNRTEITTIDGKALETDYAGNYADVCPTGSLTLKDFRFHKRAWMLKKTPSTCEGCSRGCSIELQHERNVIYRTIPRSNPAVNKHWMCDEGRFHYHSVHDEGRIIDPMAQSRSKLEPVEWKKAIEKGKDILGDGVSTVLIGSDLTLEEASSILQFVRLHFAKAEVFHFGTPGVLSSKDDRDEDRILKRTSKTSNLHGLEKLGLKGTEKLSAGTKAVLIFRGGRAVLPAIGKHPSVGVGVFSREEAAEFGAVLPGLTFAEKDGTVVNSAGLEQKFARAIEPPGEAKPISEILMLWTHSGKKAGAA